MSLALTLVRVLPLPFIGRLALAFTEIVLAAVLVSGSVIVGHNLAAWRSWYWDPATTHPWAPTPTPAATAARVFPANVLTSGAVAAPVTPAPACQPSGGGMQLMFMRPVAGGGDCIWTVTQTEGAHLLVKPAGTNTVDLGVVAKQYATPELHAYVPAGAAEPVIAVTGGVDQITIVIVFTWGQRGVVELFRAGGRRLDVSPDTSGWPRVDVTNMETTKTGDTVMRTRIYRWNGSAFVEP